MRAAVAGLAVFLAACGGGGEDTPEHPTMALRRAAMARAEAGCASHNGIGKILREEHVLAPDGFLLRIDLECHCRDGWLIRTTP